MIKILLISLTFLSIASFGQITAVNSNSDAEKLIKSFDKKSDFKIKYDTSENSETRWFWFTRLGTCDSLNNVSWLKIDVDNNGLTDFIVRGFEKGRYVTKVIFNDKNSKQRLKDFSDQFWFPCSEFKASEINGVTILNYINYYKEKNEMKVFESRVWDRKLIYKFETLVEYNQNPKKSDISSISYTANGCFGTCPVFSISINKDRTAFYIAGKYNKKEGKFAGRIKDENYTEIIDLLNYIDFKNLKDEYTTKASDGPSCELSIKLDNGEIKIIKDETMQGTFGLARIYELLDGLRTNQHWKKTAHNNVHKP
jgi:hypothetical protein